jgi:hypothetical protein
MADKFEAHKLPRAFIFRGRKIYMQQKVFPEWA